jgi:hypothetical protein
MNLRKKSICIVFEPRLPQTLPSLMLGNNCIEWSENINYLGVQFVAGKYITTDCNALKRKFYTACNCVFSNCYNVSEVVQLQLQELYCLPLLTYAAPALNVNDRQLRELNVCWNDVYRKIFKFNQWESVKGFLNGLDRLDLIHLLILCKRKYYYALNRSVNVTLFNVFKFFKLGSEYTKLVYCLDTEKIPGDTYVVGKYDILTVGYYSLAILVVSCVVEAFFHKA